MSLWLEVDDRGGLIRASDDVVALFASLEPGLQDLTRLFERRTDVRAAAGRRAGVFRFGLGRGTSRATFDVEVSPGSSGARLRLQRVEALGGADALGRLLVAHADRHPDAWVVCDPDGIVLWTDASFAWLVGHDQAELVGRPLSLVQSPRVTDREVEAYRRSLSATGSCTGPTLLRRSDGVDVSVHQSVSAVQDAAGRTTHYVTILQDTSREREFARLRSIELAVGLLGRVGGDQAHQLNNIAAEIVATCDRAMLSDDPASAGDALERVLAAGVRLGALGRQMMALSTSGESAGPADLCRVAVDLSELLSSAAGADGPQVKVELAHPSIWVQCTLDALVRACIHLALRSLEGVEAGSVVEVQALDDYDEGLLRVRYRPTPAERVALRFLIPEGHVTGPMVNELVTRAYGAGVQLGLEEERDGRVSICVRAPIAEVVSTGPARAAPTPTAWRRVLVADDNQALRDLVGVALEGLFAEVELVENGTQALQRLEALEGDLDLVILDLRMPGLGGLEVLRESVVRWPRLRVVLIAGAATDGLTRLAIEAGAQAVLPKPFRLHELKAMVRSVLADAQW